MSQGPDLDVVVAGAGPAGLAAAAACAEVGLTTALVAPEPEAVWPNTFGCWQDELAPLGLAPFFAVRWPGVRVVGTRPHHLPRPYGLLDNARLHAHLLGRLTSSGGRLVPASATGVCHFLWGSRLALDAASALDAGLVIDASGAGRLLQPARRVDPAAQDGYGIVARFDRPPVEPGSCTLMDWSPTAAPGEERAPSFLYAMDLGDGRYLVEETSLARHGPLGRRELAARLRRRLQHLGATSLEVLAEEDVLIPVGGRLPSRHQALAATGAAAGLVHPATGYSVAASLRLAPVLAAAVGDAIGAGAHPGEVSATAWRAVWPSGRRRARALERFGLRRLLAMEAAEVRAFFDAFCTLPVDRWGPYLSGTASPVEVLRTMGAVFRASPWPVRRRLSGG